MAPEIPRGAVLTHAWRERKLDELARWVKSGTLKQIISPRYDTLLIQPGDNLIEQVAFCVPRGQRSSGHSLHVKTGADTNMDVGGSIGFPNQAIFQYMRIHFEKYHSLEDAVTWKETASFELIAGYNVVLRTSLGAMDPILPRGGRKKIDRMIKTGVIRFWPWCEAKLPSVHVDSHDCFQVKVIYSKPFSPRNEMRIKVTLGPWYFRT